MENKLKIKFCKHIPFKGFYAIMLFGFLIIRKEYKDRQISQSVINHENIHFQQALDFVGGIEQLKWIGFILFYIWYILEWLIRCIISIFNGSRAYRSISFEQEAYDNQCNDNYIRNRFSWLKYLFKCKY